MAGLSKTAYSMFLKPILLKSSCFKSSENVVKLSWGLFYLSLKWPLQNEAKVIKQVLQGMKNKSKLEKNGHSLDAENAHQKFGAILVNEMLQK